MEDHPAIRDIIARAFDTEDEANLWDYLEAHDPAFRPEGIRLATVNGRPVACTVVLKRQIWTRRGWVAGPSSPWWPVTRSIKAGVLGAKV